ncbi:outer membrane protein [Helicobacter cetorum]|uniref:Putative Outer membrane protein n=1 Tax=Helicobacter cetorum (strain ATCC BAA-429 / MIT 00-7128) TaxID=182217 RepID=I0EMK2_HELC0|nr:outer membrane protein [Helicobacter cetorum]AFI04171.1 putative Outer membrane protein [Helicobacter cetorum MIT 00-7128]
MKIQIATTILLPIFLCLSFVNAETYEEMKERITKEVLQEIAQKKDQEKAKEKALHDKIMQEELKKEIYREELEKDNHSKTHLIDNSQTKPNSSHSQYERIFNTKEILDYNIMKKPNSNTSTNTTTNATSQQPHSSSNQSQPVKQSQKVSRQTITYNPTKDAYEGSDYVDTNSVYFGIGYEYGSVNSNGFDILLGYKWMGQQENTKWTGARVGVFSSLSFYTSSLFNSVVNNGIYPVYINYGVYSDWLIDAYNGENFFFGFRLGGALAGTSYFALNANDSLESSNAVPILGSSFQFLVDLGMRLGIFHHSLELGVKIPTLNDSLDFSNYGYGNVPIPRNYTFYLNYIYNYK